MGFSIEAEILRELCFLSLELLYLDGCLTWEAC